MGGTREVSPEVALERVPGGITTGIYEGIPEEVSGPVILEESQKELLNKLRRNSS